MHRHQPALNGPSSIPQSVPKGLIREYVLRALADPNAGIDHTFGAPPATNSSQTVILTGDVKPWLPRKGKKIDFAHRDAMNRHLGQLGEKFAVEVESRRLLFYERDDLAAKDE